MNMDPHPARRIWRLRKLHQFVDAELLERLPEANVALRFFLNGELSYARECVSLQAALDEAASKRAELEREGWMFHW